MEYASDADEFVRNVNQTLLILCSGGGGGSKLNDFEVRMLYYHRYKSDVTVWTSLASRIGSERFVLDLATYTLDQDDYYTLPQHLYTNSTFRELAFSYCNVVPRGPVSWKCLKELSICNGSFSDDALQKILAGSPALVILDLSLQSGTYHFAFGNSAVKKFSVHMDWESELVVSAHNVESLKVTGNFQTCTLLDMTSLVEASLGGDFSTDEYPVLCQQLLCSLANVETLTLHTRVIQGIPKLLAYDVRPSLSKCKCLTIYTHLWKTEPSAIASLLSITPEIETLAVKTDDHTLFELRRANACQHDNSNTEQLWTSQEAASGFLKQLRTVKFDNFEAYDTHAFSFIQFVLKNAKVLEKMIINLGMEGDCRNVFPMHVFRAFQKLTSFPRASPDAQLLVYQ